jgi:two-component system phosphate regulon response regulator OmpR
LRRLQPIERRGHENDGDLQAFDGWRLDRQQRRLFDPTDSDVNLTTGEYDILCVFVDNAGRVLTRDFLLDHTKGRTWEAFDRTIDAQVSRLRRKIEDDVRNPLRIKSVRGVGYIFTPRVGSR